MIQPNWCYENPIEAAQEIQRLRELCEKAIKVAEESQDWNWLDDEAVECDDMACNDTYKFPGMQNLVDKLEEIKNAL